MDGQTIEIILVEDNPADIELTLSALNEYNLANKVQVLNDGAAALDYIMNNVDCNPCRRDKICPKVILLDLKLPKVDGLEVLKRVRSDERTKTIPVVVLTSSNEERDRVKLQARSEQLHRQAREFRRLCQISRRDRLLLGDHEQAAILRGKNIVRTGKTGRPSGWSFCL